MFPVKNFTWNHIYNVFFDEVTKCFVKTAFDIFSETNKILPNYVPPISDEKSRGEKLPSFANFEQRQSMKFLHNARRHKGQEMLLKQKLKEKKRIFSNTDSASLNTPQILQVNN